MHISVNIVPHDFLQQQAENFINYHRLQVCANDYNANAARGPVQTNAVHDRFSTPFVKPVFLVINCVSNSTQQAAYRLMLKEQEGDGDWFAALNRWRVALDSVQAPVPRITDLRLPANGTLRFNFPGQRGRTNQVLCTTNFVNWSVLTNAFGTNAPIVFRDPAALSNPGRFYRVRRL